MHAQENQTGPHTPVAACADLTTKASAQAAQAVARVASFQMYVLDIHLPPALAVDRNLVTEPQWMPA
jgi:hypothetical protein